MKNQVLKNIIRRIYQTIPFKRQVFIFLKAHFELPESLWQHFWFKGSFKVGFDNKSFYMVNHNSRLETMAFWKGLEGHEKVSVEYWLKLCKQASIILDVGANAGLYALVAKTINPKAEIFAFEPIPRFYERLKHNCQLNNYDIKCRNYALSNEDGETIIYDLPLEHHYHASLSIDDVKHLGPLIKQKTQTKRLASFIKEEKIDHIDLIKIDVEGFEPEVLEGMQKELAEMKPTILIEIKQFEKARRIVDLLKNIDYIYFDIDEEGGIKKVEKPSSSSGRNYLVCTEPIAKKLNII